MKKGWFGRLVKDDSGLHSVEIALGIALIAAIAGFGMVTLGNAIGGWFEQTGENFTPGSTLPSQDTLPGGTGVSGPSNM